MVSSLLTEGKRKFLKRLLHVFKFLYIITDGRGNDEGASGYIDYIRCISQPS